VKVADYEELLASIAESREASEDDRIDDALVLSMLHKVLHSKPVVNQGFVLEGYPKTTQQAQDLFAPGIWVASLVSFEY